MSFYSVHQQYKTYDFDNFFNITTADHVFNALRKEVLTPHDLLALLSPAAEKMLEPMAVLSQKITTQNFGKAIVLYMPLYISNYCDNQCVYCGFNIRNPVLRKKLSLKEIEQEARVISSTGLRHILVLTGDSRKHSPISYICEAVSVLKKYFTSISIEIYALDEPEYKELILAGVDGLTIYQETYHEELYPTFHPSGPKRDFIYRMDAPERACKAWMRSVNIGSLLGLDDWRKDAFFTLIHARYLQNTYSDTEISISFPRLRPHTGSFHIPCPVSDKHLVQIILAARIFLHRAGIAISTREQASLRDHLVGLGVTRMSIGSKTAVGGYTLPDETGQFEISDRRTVEEFKNVLLTKGFEPVLKDWQHFNV